MWSPLKEGFDSDSGDHLTVNVSIGISVIKDNTKRVEEIIGQADDAMYKIKKSGKSNFGFLESWAWPHKKVISRYNIISVQREYTAAPAISIYWKSIFRCSFFLFRKRQSMMYAEIIYFVCFLYNILFKATNIIGIFTNYWHNRFYCIKMYVII